ncbi:Permease of the drug/metabolite transporter (DMT) superfamily [Halomicrobium zhouii]|uniref:Permease of the drug/metabolite transporter (DMT) superfamily n=1 Tax=Halomicrobium zhouii TaxID=767519 RepID=A0A1I6M2M4_9EURY|nr:EamA family transporter [Halomicrobium zhouii]SFS09913.1 Permease of the drug/metabolite transporter (DMT) superfamily [Halomicrobium zhouii]
MNQYKNIVLFLLLGVIWGGAYPAIKIGLNSIPPVLYAAVRYDIAALVMLGYIIAFREYWRPRTRDDWINATIGGVLIISAYNAFLFIGETTVPSAIAAILVGLMPIFTTVFSGVLLSTEDLKPTGILGVILGFIGILAISRPDPSNLLASSIIGQAFVLLAAASMAIGSVLTERFDADQPAITMEAWSMAISAVLLHLAALGSGEALATVRWTNSLIAMILYLSLLSSAVAYFIYFHLLDHLGAFEMNFIAYAAAVFGALIGWLVLNEQITVYTLTGYGLILTGFVLLKKDEIRQELTEAGSTQASSD